MRFHAAGNGLRPVRWLCLLLVASFALLAPGAQAAPLAGSAFDSGDGNQDNGLGLDWQGAHTAGAVKVSPDQNDDCFVGGVKELAPAQWSFNRSAGGCTPGKSNLRVGYVFGESTAATTFGHFAFLRNDTTGNSFLTFELNQAGASWKNPAGATIPCRSNGDVLLSFEVGGSTMTSSLYRWRGDANPDPACPHGGTGTFLGSGQITAQGAFQGAMNPGTPIQNFVQPGTYGGLFPGNAFGEAAVDLPAVLRSMGEDPCFGFMQMQIHSRSSSSISSAMIDYTTPVPVYLQSCAATGTQYKDVNGNGTRDAGEPGLEGSRAYVDIDGDQQLDAGEPSGVSDATGFYRILNVPSGAVTIRQAPRAGFACSQPSPTCSYSRTIAPNGNSSGNDFGSLAPSSASGTVFDDLDADGVRGPGEPGRPSVTVYADLDGDGALDAGEPTGISAGDGTFTVADVPAGTHRIRQVAAGGWVCSTSDCSDERTFTSGSATTGTVFGSYAPATVGGRVAEDADGDGTGDTPVADRTVYADLNDNDLLDPLEPQATTGATGLYAIGGLRPGPYAIRVVTLAPWYCTGPPSCERPIVLASAQTVAGRDFAIARTALVSGTVVDDSSSAGLAGFTQWVDYDNDNALDAGEPSGVSGAGGAYTITGVAAGSWTVRQAPNGAYLCVAPAGCTYPVVLASGGASTARNFRAYVSRSVSGTVYDDANTNGIRDAGERGLAGWTAYYDVTDNGPTDDDIKGVSNSLGVYRVNVTRNGAYEVKIVPQSGWTCSAPSLCRNTGSIGSGQSDTGKDFGVWGPSTISGTVFEDTDGDGAAREAGEPAIEGRVVYADTVANGTRDAGEPSATTSGQGAYAISGLAPGTYVVRQVLPAGVTCTRPSGCAHTVATASGSLTGKDFGTYTGASIGGTLFEDADADGAAREPGERALEGRTVFLEAGPGDGVKNAGEPETQTDAAGAYAFTGLAPGSYTVRQVVPAGWTQSSPQAGRALTVASGAARTDENFASYTAGGITGAVFEDRDFDGSPRVAGDPGLGGRHVFIDGDGDGAHDPGEPETATGSDGGYAFPGLTPGAYAVRFAPVAGWTCASPGRCRPAPVVVTSGDVAPGPAFGSYAGASVAGTVFEDLDADAQPREPGEPGAAGRRVFLDDGDGVREDGEPTALTGDDGTFAFAGVTAEAWVLRLELPAGWTCDTDPCAHELTLSSGSVHAGRDLGVHAAGSIAGHLFTDRDADGALQTFGENDQPERTVFLDLDGDGELDGDERSAVTDDGGDFVFTGVEPGEHHVRQVLPEGWVCSVPEDPCGHDVDVSSGEEIAGLMFSSWTTASFTGVYFEDADGDGDFPEPQDGGLDGRTVFVDTTGNGVLDASEPRTQTDDAGSFSFSGLAPDTYVVRSAGQPDGWTCSYPATCASTITLEAGERAQDVDFGAWTDGRVTGRVLDAAGAGLAGRTVFEDIDDDGEPGADEPQATTSPAGAYELVLAPGLHRIRHVVPQDWTCAMATCEHDALVTSQGTVAERDFIDAADPAVWRAGSIAGVVFEDSDGDGRAREDGEPAAQGRDVFIDANRDGMRDDDEHSTTTDADGAYRLTGVAPGEHAVRVVAPGGWSCTRPVPCSSAVTVTSGATPSAADFAIAAVNADLGVTVARDTPDVVAGRPVAWTVTARNRGPFAATGVSLAMALPAGLRDPAWTAPDGVICTLADRSLTCAVGGLAAGAMSAVEVRGTVGAGEGGKELRLAARVDGDQPDTDATDDEDAGAAVPAAQADLQAQASLPAGAKVGDVVALQLELHNDGPSDATEVTLVATLPEGLEPVAGSLPAGCTVAGRRVTCTVATLPVGATLRRAIDVAVGPDAGAGQRLDVPVQATSSVPDPTPADAAAKVAFAVTPVAAPAAPAAATDRPGAPPEGGTSPLVVSSPPAACASERAFSVHIRRRAGRRLVRVSMWLAGRKLHVGARGGRWTAQVDLRGRAPGTYTLQIRAKTAAGRWITGKRRYRTCVDRLPYDTPPL